MTMTLQIVQKMRDKAAMASSGGGSGLANNRAASTNSIFYAAKDVLAVAKLTSPTFGAEVEIVRSF